MEYRIQSIWRLGTGDTEERKIFTQVKGPNGEGI